MRAKYWSCSKFADWLRGTPKPHAETSQGWKKWYKEARAKHPFRYWLTEDALSQVQNIVDWPADKWNDLRYYINNRWVSRAHALTAHPKHIKPGQWQDFGHRIVPCLFSELQNFVEIELAWKAVVWDDAAREKYQVPTWRTRFFRWRTWRCPAAGIAHLEWETSLTYVDKDGKEKPTAQAKAAMEILELYHWWTEERPNRPDVYEITGWSDYCDRKRDEDPDDIVPEDKTPAERKSTRKMLADIRRYEKKFESEDEAMLIRLIKIRQSLWS